MTTQRKNAIVMSTATLALLLAGCAAHEITSSPPGATIYIYKAAGMHPIYGEWSLDEKPAPEQMLYVMEESYPTVTPHTFKGNIFGRWYQVRKEGYFDSDIVFLEKPKGTLSHHFVLKKRPDPLGGEE
ncbi:MAG: hypothetical protein JXN61_01845 [Sedimentisphaerales bacterium]|nr:hypothetical protein [Sedimentisphaerales bacterium]